MANSRPTPQITTGGKDLLPPAISLLSGAFETDPVITYMLSASASSTQSTRTGYLPSYFKALLTAATMNGATIDEVSGWKCCGILMPPGRRVDNWWTLLPAGFIGVAWGVGVGGLSRMLLEYTPFTDAAKAKALKGRTQYYYVFFVGTAPSGRRQGLCSALIREYQSRAQKDGVPLWLEATTDYSMRLYAKLGFTVMEEMVLGKGKVGPDGLAKEGGKGVKIWGMVWEAEGK